MAARSGAPIVWLARATWAALPIVAAPAFAAALDQASQAVQRTCAAGLWLGWVTVLTASLVPTTVSLTVVRVLAPCAFVAGAAAALAHPGASAAAALALAALADALLFAAAVGTRFAAGSAYGDETRLFLRPPGLILLGAVPLAWTVAVAAVAGGPLLLAARQWVPGIVTTIAAVPLAYFVGRAMHRLSQRWVVFVPAGVVLHDRLALVEPVLFRRPTITLLAPASIPTEAVDLTMGAPGLALELDLADAVELPVLSARREASIVRGAGVLFTPTRPGQVLAEAARRGVKT